MISARLYRYAFAHRSGLLVRLENEGRCSWGEIAPLPGYSKESLEQATAQAKRALAQEEHGPLFPSVAWGLSSAFAALKTKPRALRVPLSGLLQGTAQQILAKADKLEALDVGTAKLKVSHLTLAEAIALAKELHLRFRLRIDVQRRWSLPEALQFCSHFTASSFEYFEEPLQNTEDLIHFPFPFALDETLREKGGERFLTLPHFAAAVVKPMLSGCLGKNTPLILSHSYESGIGIARLAGALASSSLAMGLDTSDLWKEDLLQTPLHIDAGHLCVPEHVAPQDELLTCLS